MKTPGKIVQVSHFIDKKPKWQGSRELKWQAPNHIVSKGRFARNTTYPECPQIILFLVSIISVGGGKKYRKDSKHHVVCSFQFSAVKCSQEMWLDFFGGRILVKRLNSVSKLKMGEREMGHTGRTYRGKESCKFTVLVNTLLTRITKILGRPPNFPRIWHHCCSPRNLVYITKGNETPNWKHSHDIIVCVLKKILVDSKNYNIYIYIISDKWNLHVILCGDKNKNVSCIGNDIEYHSIYWFTYYLNVKFDNDHRACSISIPLSS